ncbi:MAG: HK97 family phage prohead protease [Candidatus Levybacteria bacterium]|nr:HK97 family phage prohead protease [Candidatus Levybacteria bacterium]
MNKAVIRKTYQAETKAASEDRTLVVKITTSNPDRSSDVVLPQGAILDNYQKNPVVALNHKYDGLAIAKTEQLEVIDDGILAKVKFPELGVYELADTVYELYKGGFMNAWSIGFIPVEMEDRDGGGREFKKWELLEYSAVLVPDNPEALTMLRSKGIEVTDEGEIIETKGVIPFKDTPNSDKDTLWDGPAEVIAASVEDLKVMCAWFDSANPDIKVSYKLPHHKASGDHPVVWRGVAAAMAALLGARGGVDIPDSDRRGVYNHLSKHYSQYDEEPPEFKEYSEEESKEVFGDQAKGDPEAEASAVDNGQEETPAGESSETPPAEAGVPEETQPADKEIKEGRVLSEKNRKLVSDCLILLKNTQAALQALLDASEREPKDLNGNQLVVIDLAEALKAIDKVAGVALRDLKRKVTGELGTVPEDSRVPIVIGEGGGK